MAPAENSEFGTDEIERLRADTPGCRNWIHFNNAGAGLMPTPVVEAAVAHLQLEAEIGGYEAELAAEGALAGFYEQTAKLLNARPEHVAYVANATDAYMKALSAVPFEAGDVILTTRNDYISNQINFLSLRKRFGVEIVHAPDAPEGGVDVAALAALVEQRKPALVAVTHIPSNSGLVQPVEAVGAVCREHDVLYLVDACQSVGQRVVDVERIGCNFLSASSRKFLRGPRGSGFLYISGETLRAGFEPLYIDMRGARWTGESEYEPAATARRFEDWESSYALMLAAAAANRYAVEVGIERIQTRATALASELRAALADDERLRVLDRGPELAALVTVQVAGWESEAFKRALDEARVNSSISYHDVAQYDFGDKNVEWCVRLSPHYYNTSDEVAEVARAVQELAARPR